MSAVGRLLPRPRDRHDGYVFCAEDGYWFRPAYTEGRCPLCGEAAVGGAPATDRSWVAPAVLALESLVMLILVLVLYFHG